MSNLQIDASTPAIAVQSVGTTATVVTGTFAPPAGSVLAIRYSANTIDPVDPGNPGITDSLGAHLTYASSDIGKQPNAPTADGQVATWTATVPSPAPGSMTVTVTNGAGSGNRHAALSVTVLTGADTITPVGQHGKSSSTTNIASIAAGYTATRAGSWGLLVVCDWFDAGAETAGGTGNTLEGSADVASNYTYAFLRRTAADGVAGATTTVTATLPGNSNNIRWAWMEILPALDPPSASAQMPPWLMYRMVLLRLQTATEIIAQAQAEAGSATFALRTTGAAVKVAVQRGSAILAARTTGTAAKVAPETGTALVAVTATGMEAAGTARAQTGSTVLALRSTGTASKIAKAVGPTSVALAGGGAAGKRAPEVGTAELAVRSSGAAVHQQAQAGSSVLVTRVTGTASNRIATQSGKAEIALAVSSAPSKTVGATGAARVAITAVGVEATGSSRPQSGSAVLALRSTSAARRSAIQTGAAMLPVRVSGTAAKVTTEVGTALVPLRTLGAASNRRAVQAGRSTLAMASAGLQLKRAATSGRATVVLLGFGTQAFVTPRVPLGDRLEEILNTLISFTARLGIFQSIMGHEPKSAPRNGISAALWLQTMAPAIGQSSLDSTSMRVAWYLRIYQNFLSKPEDAIDPKIMRAMAAVMEALSANFDLDLPGVRAIDLLGMTGPPMAAEAGYVPMDGKLFRCMTLTIPIIVDDVFVQTA